MRARTRTDVSVCDVQSCSQKRKGTLPVKPEASCYTGSQTCAARGSRGGGGATHTRAANGQKPVCKRANKHELDVSFCTSRVKANNKAGIGGEKKCKRNPAEEALRSHKRAQVRLHPNPNGYFTAVHTWSEAVTASSVF